MPKDQKYISKRIALTKFKIVPQKPVELDVGRHTTSDNSDTYSISKKKTPAEFEDALQKSPF